MLASSKMRRGLGKGFSKECKIGACKQLYSYLKIQIESHVREKQVNLLITKVFLVTSRIDERCRMISLSWLTSGK